MNVGTVIGECMVWINTRDPFYFLGVWDSLYLGKTDPFSS